MTRLKRLSWGLRSFAWIVLLTGAILAPLWVNLVTGSVILLVAASVVGDRAQYKRPLSGGK